ncbi:MAG: hypothetical protein QOE36_3380 [Gaiellaceae bacterium]|nr:hypothetical protein [Gaiellaceae bacterium]
MGADAARVARTESFFRHVNERIAESAEGFGGDEAEFVCECADPTCTHRVELTLVEYERVREESTTFLLQPGHEDERVERVIRRGRGYAVVDKFHRKVAQIVRQLDPRQKPV